MATLQTITNNAFRELGITAVGDSPETAEYNEGFALLQNIASTIVGYEMGENLTDINLGSGGSLNAAGLSMDATSEITSLYVPNNVKIMCNLSAPVTVYLHPRPREGDRAVIVDSAGNFGTYNLTIQGNGRKISNGVTATSSVALNSNNQNVAYFYRADLGQWWPFDVSVDTLQSPFASSFDDLLVLALAKRLAPRYGATWQPTQEENLQRMLKTFRARYRQETEVDSEWALVRLPSVNRSQNYFSNSPSKFDKGLL